MKGKGNIVIAAINILFAAIALWVGIECIRTYFTGLPVEPHELTATVIAWGAFIGIGIAVAILLVASVLGLIRGTAFKKTVVLTALALILCWAFMPVGVTLSEKIYFANADYERIDEERAERCFNAYCDRLEELAERNRHTLTYRQALKEIERPTALGGYAKLVISQDADDEYGDIEIEFIYFEEHQLMAARCTFDMVNEEGADSPDADSLKAALEYFGKVAKTAFSAEQCREVAADDSYAKYGGDGAFYGNMLILDDYTYLSCREYSRPQRFGYTLYSYIACE